MSTPPGLGPHLVGTRVVVRRLLRGERGPTGGPAFTDVLGVMESWAEGVTTVRDAAGEVTAIAVADIVSGKPVPPRPSTRLRVSAEDAERHAHAVWPPVETRPLGEWLLRAAGGFSSRANSVLACGDPGLPLDEALAEVRAFYAGRGLPAWAQVVVGSGSHTALEAAGWALARPGEADTCFQVASVARALRLVRRLRSASSAAGDGLDVAVHDHLTEAWLATDDRARAHGDVARRVLEGSAQEGSTLVGFAEVTAPDGTLVARGRVSVEDDWAGITDVWVFPAHRRRGLGLVVMEAMLDRAAERGATTAFLQTRGDNPAALALYERLGFLTNHTYRYLVAA